MYGVSKELEGFRDMDTKDYKVTGLWDRFCIAVELSPAFQRPIPNELQIVYQGSEAEVGRLASQDLRHVYIHM